MNAPRGHCASETHVLYNLTYMWTLHRVTRRSREPGGVGRCVRAAGLRSGHNKVSVTLHEYILEVLCTVHTLFIKQDYVLCWKHLLQR